MSFEALSWAAKQRPGNLAAKMVLLALANWADEHGCAYPSTAAIAEFGDMDHKTATVALDRLNALELVADTGEREGRTKQIKVYRLNLESIPKTEAYQKRKPPVSPPKAPQKRGTDTVRDTKPKKATPSLGKRATSFPSNFEPVMTGKTLTTVSGWPPGRLEDELEHFADHHVAKGTTSFDWQASWRTWVKNSKRWEPRNANGQSNSGHGLRGSRPDPALDMHQDACRRLAEEGPGIDSEADFGIGAALPAYLAG